MKDFDWWDAFFVVGSCIMLILDNDTLAIMLMLFAIYHKVDR